MRNRMIKVQRLRTTPSGLAQKVEASKKAARRKQLINRLLGIASRLLTWLLAIVLSIFVLSAVGIFVFNFALSLGTQLATERGLNALIIVVPAAVASATAIAITWLPGCVRYFAYVLIPTVSRTVYHGISSLFKWVNKRNKQRSSTKTQSSVKHSA